MFIETATSLGRAPETRNTLGALRCRVAGRTVRGAFLTARFRRVPVGNIALAQIRGVSGVRDTCQSSLRVITTRAVLRTQRASLVRLFFIEARVTATGFRRRIPIARSTDTAVCL